MQDRINNLENRFKVLEEKVKLLEENYKNILDRISEEFGSVREEISEKFGEIRDEIKVIVRDETKTSAKEAVNEALSEWFGNPDNMSDK